MPTVPTQVLPQLATQIGYLPTEHGWVQIPIAFAPPGYAVMKSPYPNGSLYGATLVTPNSEKDKEVGSSLPGMPSMAGSAMFPGQYFPQAMRHPGLVIPQAGGSLPSRRNLSPNSAARSSGYHPSMQMGTALSSALNLTMSSPVQNSVPPVSSIRASEITKCHIERMKEVIRYNEDQIQLNKHQIDEKALREQNDQVKSLIETFEKTYDMQVQLEQSYQSNEKSKTYVDINHGQQDTKLDHTGPDNIIYHHIGRDTSPVKYAPWSSLPRGAVAAAPFQPRNELTPAEKAYYFTHQVEPTTNSSGSNSSIGATIGSSASISMENEAQRSVESSKNVTFVDGVPQMKDSNAPYLVGQLPPGRNPRDGFVYSRELTEEEKMSRYLYWGRASKAARRGLPKFDGQNFYPPSPPKERESVQGLFLSPDSANTAKAFQGVDPFRRPIFPSGVAECHAGEMKTASIATPTGITIPNQVSTRATSEFLKNIIKKGPTCSNVIPGAVSSTTAQGILPQYAGHATAALSPAIAESPSLTTEPRLEAPSDDFPEAELRLRELAVQDLRKGGLSPPE